MKKYFSIFFLLILTSTFAFSAGISDLQTALDNKDLTQIQNSLDTAAADEVADFEKLILNQAKSSVSEDDLDFASSLAEMVLMFDFDNSEAQKLYTSIEKAKKTKAETLARQEEEERKRQEAEAKRLEEEEQKRQLEEYKAQKAKEAKDKDDYIESVSSISFANFPISGGLHLPLEFSRSSFANEYNNSNTLYTRLGIGGTFDFGFRHPYFEAKLNATYTFYPIDFKDAGHKSDLRTRFTIGVPAFSPWFRLCAGFNSFKILGDVNSAIYKSITAPTLGVGFDNLTFGNLFKLAWYLDINLITFDNYSHIDFAYDTELSLKYFVPYEIFPNGKIFIEGNAVFNELIISKQNEWNLATSVNVGVSINE